VHLEVRLRERLSPGAGVHPDEPLARRTTLRVGGVADLLVEPDGEWDLAVVLEDCRRFAVPWMVLGRGSNLLVRDGGVRGVIIASAGRFARIDIDADRLRRSAACEVRTAPPAGLAGLEFLFGIPAASVLRMNAGANATTFDRLEGIRFMAPDGTVHERPAAEVPGPVSALRSPARPHALAAVVAR
jgi:UDP-N-acetylenolpyruvoylglucosamine reductase